MTDKKKPALADYEVTTAREINGQHRAKGEIIQMQPAQAKYYLPPLGSGLKVASKKTAFVTKATKPDG